MKKTISISKNIAVDWADIEEAAKAYGQDIGVDVGVAVFIVNVLWKQYKEMVGKRNRQNVDYRHVR